MLFLSKLYPVALVTDPNQTIRAIPAAGLTQTSCPCEGAADVASSLKQKYSHQCIQQLSPVQVNMQLLQLPLSSNSISADKAKLLFLLKH